MVLDSSLWFGFGVMPTRETLLQADTQGSGFKRNLDGLN
jgi:hypothetical protein